MREILFRGKRPNGCWVQGDLTQFCIDGVMTSKISNHDLRATLNGLRVSTYTNEVDPSTLGQYTGLTDKYGKRIFEGDIIQSLETKETAVVQWFPEHSAFTVWCKYSNEVGFLYECTKIIEVIGNIHDNPELLKGAGQ